MIKRFQVVESETTIDDVNRFIAENREHQREMIVEIDRAGRGDMFADRLEGAGFMVRRLIGGVSDPNRLRDAVLCVKDFMQACAKLSSKNDPVFWFSQYVLMVSRAFNVPHCELEKACEGAIAIVAEQIESSGQTSTPEPNYEAIGRYIRASERAYDLAKERDECIHEMKVRLSPDRQYGHMPARFHDGIVAYAFDPAPFHEGIDKATELHQAMMDAVNEAKRTSQVVRA